MSSAVYINLTLNAVLLQTNLCCQLLESILNQNNSVFSCSGLFSQQLYPPRFSVKTWKGGQIKNMIKEKNSEHFTYSEMGREEGVLPSFLLKFQKQRKINCNKIYGSFSFILCFNLITTVIREPSEASRWVEFRISFSGNWTTYRCHSPPDKCSVMAPQIISSHRGVYQL